MAKLTVGDTFPVWWAHFWRVGLLSGPVGAIIGAIAGALGAPDWALILLVYLFCLPISMWAMRAALSIDYNAIQVSITRRRSDDL